MIIRFKVGRILEAIDRLGLYENTYVYFTSDHGAHIDIGKNGGSNLPFKGGKGMGAIEGGIRVPGVVRWPKKQSSNKGHEISLPTTLMDFLPTLKEIVERENINTQELSLPNPIDGESFFSLLVGENSNTQRLIRHYCGSSVHALRLVDNDRIYKGWFKRPLLNSNGHCGRGQLCSCFGGSDVLENFGCDPEIFDLTQDPTEDTPLLKTSKTYIDLKWKFVQEYLRIHPKIDDLDKCFQDIAYSGRYDKAITFDNMNILSQYTSFFDVMPRPWMQPCARFPRCSAK